MASSEQIGRFSTDYFSLEGKVAVVTGANTGLGMAYAAAFAKAGADLYIPHFTDDVSEVKALVEEQGRRAVFLKGDLRDAAHIAAVVSGCLFAYGKIDILVNNAGMSRFADFADYPADAWRDCIDLNLNAVWHLSHAVAKVMIGQKSGKIINIGSALSYTADKKCPPYVTAKHGVIGITRALANELGRYNIRCNAICPGFFATDVNRELRADRAFYDKITDRIPLGRWGDLDDLMGAAVFLASRASDYINGWDISIDGGFTTTL